VIVLTNDIHPDLPPGLASRTCTVSSDLEIERAGRTVAHYFVHSCPPVPDAASAPRAARSEPGDLEKRASRD
jgi:hypothetical protein